MKVGFTGTQQGLMMAQADAVDLVLRGFEPTEFHHGDCVGADAQACEIVWRMPRCYEGRIKIVSHPPDNDKKRAHAQSHVELAPLPYLDRNKKIVDATEILVAAPAGVREEVRSGTWATVRYARKRGKPILLVLPTGEHVMDADYRPPHVWPDTPHPNPPVGFDMETEVIRPGLQAPPMVCMQLAWSPREYELVHHTEARPYFEALLEQPLIAGANTAFDMSVGAAKWPDLIPRIFEAYEEDRVTDVLIREKLIHIALGVYRGYRTEDGKWIHLDYALDDVAQRRCGVVLVKSEWQLRFGELRDTPVAFWPEAAQTYAVQDGIAPVEVWKKQEDAREFLEDEFRQARAAWWIQLMSCWGIKCDPEGVREFARKTQQQYDEIAEVLIGAGLVRRQRGKIVRNEKLAREYMAYICARDGKKPALTKGGKDGTKPQVKIDDDSCQRLGDDLLKKYGDFSSLTKTLSTDIPLLESGVHVPIQAHFETMLETGRTSSAPNVQNFPTKAGMRECVVPEDGCVFAIGDFSGMELRTWSQCIILNNWYSRMADFLNSGGDPHCELARRILNMGYEECVADYKRDPKGQVYYPRQASKSGNFGFPGGLGLKRFVDYARTQYGVVIAEDKAKELKQFWREAWPESGPWFQWVKVLTSVQSPRIEQFYSRRFRGDVGFCDGANTFFQGLAADAAKAAGFLVSRACYVDRDSPLYGGRIVNFVHDELIVAVADNDNAHDAAIELGRLMVEGARPWIPDVPPVVEPLLARRWSKAAKPLIHPRTGRLVPWDFGVADELKKLEAA